MKKIKLMLSIHHVEWVKKWMKMKFKYERDRERGTRKQNWRES